MQNPHQVSSDERSNEETHVNVDGMAAMLRDLSQTRQSPRNGKSEHQHWLQQFGAV